MNRNVKTIISGICLSASLLTTAVPQALALSETTAAPESTTISMHNTIAPYMAYINDADLTFSISGGKAYVDGWVRGQSGVATRCKITANLQVKSGLTWSTVKTWSDDQNGRRASISGNYTVTSGKSYRVTATVIAYNGAQSESKQLVSKTIKA